ncbi:hypothetical protein ACFS7Z_25925 [Pontibacter toksunensis]|uniref:Uncharacterized protein n=1 Tax=Pontibacter toksunensis TaxID=1332631 RepID=A0ABW6C425_9BACT
MLYERTAISKQSEVTIQNDLQQLKESSQLTADLVFRDPYVPDFLGLADTYSEKDLEASVIIPNSLIKLDYNPARDVLSVTTHASLWRRVVKEPPA